MIFKNYAQYVKISKENQQISIDPEIYPFGAEIRFVIPIGNHLAVITATNLLLMVESKPPFKRVIVKELSFGCSPLTSPIAFCTASASGENLVACGYAGQAVVASFDSSDTPTLTNITLPDNIVVHSVVATQNPEEFIMLITVLSSMKKYLIKINVNDNNVSQYTLVSPTVRQLVTVFDQDNYGKQYLFADNQFIYNKI